MQPSNPPFPPAGAVPHGAPGAPFGPGHVPGASEAQTGFGPGVADGHYPGPRLEPGGWPTPGGPVPPGPYRGDSDSGGRPGTGAPGSAKSVPPVVLVGLLGVVLVALGLALPFDATCAFATQTAWSIFAILAALAGAIGPLLGSGSSRRTGWLVTAGAAGALVGYWLLIVLPGVSSNPGFTLTLGVAAVAVAAWFSPARPR